jgi:hypothetical protein
VKTGALGKVRFAKGWESAQQGSIGNPPDSDPPAGLDYDFWLGPAPLRPFNRVRFHGNWRWFFDYGTGDLGNDGVHRLDVARWALETGIAQGENRSACPGPFRAGASITDDSQEGPTCRWSPTDYPGYVTYECVFAAYHLHDESEGRAVRMMKARS